VHCDLDGDEAIERLTLGAPTDSGPAARIQTDPEETLAGVAGLPPNASLNARFRLIEW
jgi:hypothetical protein